MFNKIKLRTGAHLSMPLGELHLDGSAAQQEFYKGMMANKYDSLEHAVACFDALAIITAGKGMPVPYDAPAPKVVEERVTADDTKVTLYDNGLCLVEGTNDALASKYAEAAMTCGGKIDKVVECLNGIWAASHANNPFTVEQTCNTNAATAKTPLIVGGDELHTAYLGEGYMPKQIPGYEAWSWSGMKRMWWCVQTHAASKGWKKLFNGMEYRTKMYDGERVNVEYREAYPALQDAIRIFNRHTNVELYLTEYLIGKAERAKVAN